MSVSVCPPGHLVPGTNSEIEGLTLAKSGTNISKDWDLRYQREGLTISKSAGTNNRKEWD